MSQTTSPWENNAIQFPRLLCEIMATQPTLDLLALAESMDLDLDDVNELFDRANDEWERIKARPQTSAEKVAGASDRMFYRHTYTVEVLSEKAEPCSNAGEVAHEISSGDDCGKFSVSSETLTGAEAAEALTAMGSSPEFFRLDATGNDIDDYL